MREGLFRKFTRKLRKGSNFDTRPDTCIYRAHSEVSNMNSTRSTKSVWGILLAFTFLVGIGVVSGTPAQAQVWGRNRQDGTWDRDRDDRYRNRDYRRDRRRDRRDNDGRWDRNRNDGYRRGGYGGYGNNGYNQAAQNQGYQDGLYTGSRDAQRRQSYNPQRSHFYKDGSSGYKNGQYLQVYRQGFLQGYRQGYQQYGGGRNGGYNNGRNNTWRLPW